MSFAGKLRDGRRRATLFFYRVPQWLYISLLALGVGTAGYFLGHGGGKGSGDKGGKQQSASPPAQPQAARCGMQDA